MSSSSSTTNTSAIRNLSPMARSTRCLPASPVTIWSKWWALKTDQGHRGSNTAGYLKDASRTNLFAKVVIALLLDEDAARILNVQRSALLESMRQLTRAKQQAALLDVLAYDHALLRIEADIRWIDMAEVRLNVKESLS